MAEFKKEHTETERLFVAVTLPDVQKEKLRLRCAQDLQDALFRKYSDYRDYHITLQFLGDTLRGDMDKLIDVLREAAADRERFSLRMGKWDIFGPEKAPRVLWREVLGDVVALHHLYTSIVQATRPLGFVPEDRPYRPHVTVARSYAGSEPFPDRFLHEKEDSEEAWNVSEFVLYATRLGQKPMYQIIQTFPIGRRLP